MYFSSESWIYAVKIELCLFGYCFIKSWSESSLICQKPGRINFIKFHSYSVLDNCTNEKVSKIMTEKIVSEYNFKPLLAPANMSWDQCGCTDVKDDTWVIIFMSSKEYTGSWEANSKFAKAINILGDTCKGEFFGGNL